MINGNGDKAGGIPAHPVRPGMDGRTEAAIANSKPDIAGNRQLDPAQPLSAQHGSEGVDQATRFPEPCLRLYLVAVSTAEHIQRRNTRDGGNPAIDRRSAIRFAPPERPLSFNSQECGDIS